MAFLHGATATHSGPKSGIKSRSITPYLLLAPGLIWLVTFFIIPILSLASTSTMVRPEGAQVGTYVQELRFQNYVDAFLANQDQYIRYGFSQCISRNSNMFSNSMICLTQMLAATYSDEEEESTTTVCRRLPNKIGVPLR